MSKISRIFTTYRMSNMPFYSIANTSQPIFPTAITPLAPIQEHETQGNKQWEYQLLNTDHDILATEIATEVAEAALE